MFVTDHTYDDFARAEQEGKKVVVRGNALMIHDKYGMPISYTPLKGNVVVLQPFFDLIAVHLNKQSVRMRWMRSLNKWQDLTNLFVNYGTDNASVPEEDIAKYNVAIGRIVPVPDVSDPDFQIMYEIQHGRLYIHCFVYKWNRDVIRKMRDEVEKLQQTWPYDTYTYSFRPNEEYALSGDISFKFAKLAGYKYYETVVLGDGYEHDIYKRDRSRAATFISGHD